MSMGVDKPWDDGLTTRIDLVGARANQTLYVIRGPNLEDLPIPYRNRFCPTEASFKERGWNRRRGN